MRPRWTPTPTSTPGARSVPIGRSGSCWPKARAASVLGSAHGCVIAARREPCPRWARDGSRPGCPFTARWRSRRRTRRSGTSWIARATRASWPRDPRSVRPTPSAWAGSWRRCGISAVQIGDGEVVEEELRVVASHADPAGGGDRSAAPGALVGGPQNDLAVADDGERHGAVGSGAHAASHVLPAPEACRAVRSGRSQQCVRPGARAPLLDDDVALASVDLGGVEADQPGGSLAPQPDLDAVPRLLGPSGA